jgi:hypothetical protein
VSRIQAQDALQAVHLLFFFQDYLAQQPPGLRRVGRAPDEGYQQLACFVFLALLQELLGVF